jgi:hypothetical protein
MPISFKDYINNINEGEAIIKDFSFGAWLLESEKKYPEIRPMVRAMSDPVALEKAELIMSLVKQKLFAHFPIWKPFWDKMPPIASFGAGDTAPDGIGTMCTTGTAIFYDPRFVIISYEMAKKEYFPDGRLPNPLAAVKEGKRYPIDYALFVMIHEILHCALRHHLRTPVPSTFLTPMEVATLWNLAADYEINHKLLDDPKADLYLFSPGGVRADEGGFKVPAEELEFFTTSTAERIFKRLLLNLEEKRRKQQEEKDKQKEAEEEESEESGEEEGEGGSGEGDESGEGGESGENGEGEGEGGDNEGGDNESPLKPGDVIYDRESGEYGVVTQVSGDDIDYEPISEEEARKRTNK